MKRLWSILLLVCILTLSACAGKPAAASEPSEVEYGGKQYRVEMDKNGLGGTVTVDGYVCSFTLSGRGENVRLDVTYPDGSTYWWLEGKYAGSGGWSDDYDRNKYVPGNVLWEVLEQDAPGTDSGRGGKIFLGLLVAVMGLVNAVKPEIGWYLSHGWHYKNAEPSELSLAVTSIGGVFVTVMGLGYALFA